MENTNFINYLNEKGLRYEILDGVIVVYNEFGFKCYDMEGNHFYSNYASEEDAKKVVAALRDKGIDAFIGPKGPWNFHGKPGKNKMVDDVGVYLVTQQEYSNLLDNQKPSVVEKPTMEQQDNSSVVLESLIEEQVEDELLQDLLCTLENAVSIAKRHNNSLARAFAPAAAEDRILRDQQVAYDNLVNRLENSSSQELDEFKRFLLDSTKLTDEIKLSLVEKIEELLAKNNEQNARSARI